MGTASRCRRGILIVTERVAKRFWDKVRLPDANGCTTWMKYCDKNGYGRFNIQDDQGRWSTQQAHRVAWLITHGEWPGELDHLCENQSCVAPAHLEDVEHRLNMHRHYRVTDVCRQCGMSDWYVFGPQRRVCNECRRRYRRARYHRTGKK